MIVRTAPGNGRYASISSVDLQFLGIKDGAPIDGFMQKVICLAAPYVPIDGMNEAGVAVGIYMSYQGDTDNVTATDQNTDRPDLTSTTMLRMILDYAGSVDEAIQLVSQYDLHDSAGTSFHYMVAAAGGSSIDVVPYRTFGTPELAQAAAEGLQVKNACLLEHHGVLACGTSLDRALNLAAEVENLAHQYTVVRSLGEPRLIPDEEMVRIIERFKTYGQPQSAVQKGEHHG